MKTAVLLTHHIWNSKRKAGFHWIADSLWRAGWEVYFVTDYFSWLDRLKKDYRLAFAPKEGMRKVVREKERFYSYVCGHPWRPVLMPTPLLNQMTYPFFMGYGNIPLPGLEEVARRADLFIFEPSFGMLFFDRFKRLNPSARYVFRVSDNIDLYPWHPLMTETERRIAPRFDLVSSPTQMIHEKFAALPQARLHWHGVPYRLFDKECESPYPPGTTNAIFVGANNLDLDFVERASRVRSGVHFHIIGPFGGLPERPNLHVYGERPYEETIPYIKWADLGLNARIIPSLSDSNKTMLFSYCRLPFIIADLDPPGEPHVFAYRVGDDESIAQTIDRALAYDRSQIRSKKLQSWDDLTATLVGETPATDGESAASDEGPGRAPALESAAGS